MCYLTILSTDSAVDLRQFNSRDLVFDKTLPGIPEERLLKYEHRWFVGSAHGCSCGFRHLMFQNFTHLGFSAPESWFPEEADDIEATLKLARVLRGLVEAGSRVDGIDAWQHEPSALPKLSGQVTVRFSEVSDAAFRLIENAHHEFAH